MSSEIKTKTIPYILSHKSFILLQTPTGRDRLPREHHTSHTLTHVPATWTHPSLLPVTSYNCSSLKETLIWLERQRYMFSPHINHIERSQGLQNTQKMPTDHLGQVTHSQSTAQPSVVSWHSLSINCAYHKTTMIRLSFYSLSPQDGRKGATNTCLQFITRAEDLTGAECSLRSTKTWGASLSSTLVSQTDSGLLSSLWASGILVKCLYYRTGEGNDP